MGILKRLTEKALSPYINLFNYRTGALQQIPLTLGQPAVYPTQDILNYVKAYSANPSVFTIVKTIANKFGYIPRYVYEILDEDAAEDYQKYIRQKDFQLNRAKKMLKKAYRRARKVKNGYATMTRKNYGEYEVDNPLSMLLQNPNPQYGQDSFFELQDIFYELTGECFIWLDRGGISVNPYGQPQDNDQVEGPARLKLPILAMHVLPAQYMAMNVNRQTFTGDILNWIFIRQGQQIFLPKEDVIHWKTPNPNYDGYNFTHLRGQSALQAGLRLYTADDASVDALVAMHQNDGAKGILYNSDKQSLTIKQQSDANNAIDNKINNRAMKSAVAMLPGDWGYLYLGQNAVDMDLLNSQDKMFSRLCNLYGVNPNFFLSGQTFDNLSQARKDFITQTEMPRVCSNRDELNRVLLQAFNLSDEQYAIDVDVTELPEMAEDMGKLATALSLIWYITPNEKRELINQERSDDPNMDEIWIPNNLTLMDDAALPMPAIGGYNPNGSDGQVPDGSPGLPADQNVQGGSQGGDGDQNPKGNGVLRPANLK